MNKSMWLACIALTVIVALGVGPTFAQSADEVAINSRIEGLYAALDKGDVKAYVASFHENAVRAIGTDIVIGPLDIEKAAAEAFAQGGLPIKFTRHATWLLSPTTALVHGSTENVSTNLPTKGHTMITLVKEDEWLVAGLQAALSPSD